MDNENEIISEIDAKIEYNSPEFEDAVKLRIQNYLKEQEKERYLERHRISYTKIKTVIPRIFALCEYEGLTIMEFENLFQVLRREFESKKTHFELTNSVSVISDKQQP